MFSPKICSILNYTHAELTYIMYITNKQVYWNNIYGMYVNGLCSPEYADIESYPNDTPGKFRL